MKKKSYNPFKMWGSYVGAILGAIFAFPFAMWIICFGTTPKILEFLCYIKWSYVTWIIVGFLLGWGIHSLIRKLRK